MSASREKKKRSELTQAGISPKQLAAKAKAKKRRKVTITAIIIAAVAVVAIGLGFYKFYFLPRHAPKTTVAATIGEHTLTAADMNYYYMDTAYQFYQNSSSYISYMLDTSVGLDEQYYDEEKGQTWADYLLEQAAQSAADYYALYDKAIEEGFTLTEEQEQELEDQYKMVEDSILSSDQYSSMDQYLSSYYGKGCTAESYRAYLDLQQFVSMYTSAYSEGLTYTDDDLNAVVAENPDKYTNLTYRSYYIPLSNYQSEDDTDTTDTTADADTNTVDAAALAAAEADAKEMAEAAQGNEEAYLQYTRDLNPEDSEATYEDDNTTLKENDTYDNIPELVRSWLYDPARQEGDTTYLNSSDTGFYVLYFISRQDNDYNTMNVRHILISPEKDEDSDDDGTNDASSDEALAAAEQKAEDLLAEWKAGDATEESFGKLAEEHSDDSAKEGLYENITKGQMVQEFEDWCFDPAREPGETGIVKTQYGYHIMYFSSVGRNCRLVNAEKDVRQEDFDAWRDGITEGSTYTLDKAGEKYINKNITMPGQ